MPADCAASGRPAAGRTRRVPPLGTGSAAMQPGRSAAPAAPRTEPAAARSPQPGSGPAGAEKPGLERRSWAASGRGGGRKEGPSSPAPRERATPSSGDPSRRCPRLPQGEAGVVGGRPPTSLRDLQGPAKSLKPGVDRFSGSGFSPARQPAHRLLKARVITYSRNLAPKKERITSLWTMMREYSHPPPHKSTSRGSPPVPGGS
ncbi:hypothetical protein AB1E18_005789 [Capra hircus]